MKRILPWIAAALTVIVWAETFVSTKQLLNLGIQPPDIFLYRFILAYCGIWGLCALEKSGRKGTAITRKERFADELRFLALGVFGGSLYFLLENTALKYSTASNVSILVGSAPLLTGIVVGSVYREERLSARQWVGSLISFIGMAMVVLNGQLVLHLNPLGDSLAIGAALAWAFYSLIFRKVSDKFSVIFVTRKVFGYGLLTMMVYLLAVRGIGTPISFNAAVMGNPTVWGTLIYLGLVASLLCFVAWNYAIKRLGATRTTNLIYGQSIMTMLIAAIVLGERITIMAIAGAIALIAGMVLAIRKQ